MSDIDKQARGRAIFLDRDGVINVERNYVHRIEDFEYLPGALPGLRLLAAQGFQLVVVTNQSGIGRGLYSEAQFEKLNTYMMASLLSEGISISAIYFCPHHPTEGIGKYRSECECRKPKPGMLLRAAKEIGIDLRSSVLIGDKRSDIAAGHSAGVGTCVLVRTGHAVSQTDIDFSHVCLPDLPAAAEWLKARDGGKQRMM